MRPITRPAGPVQGAQAGEGEEADATGCHSGSDRHRTPNEQRMGCQVATAATCLDARAGRHVTTFREKGQTRCPMRALTIT
ncbi:hypothetical protein GCM10023259_049920 [Thermocatellispora tengchongensis]